MDSDMNGLAQDKPRPLPRLLCNLIVIVAVAVLVPLPASATPAPTELAATYYSSTQDLTLTWTQNPSDSASSWKVYRDGNLLATVTSKTYTDNLATWNGGLREYHVTALDSASVESGASNTIWVAETPGGGPLHCPPVNIVLGSIVPPSVDPQIHEECLPL